MNAIKLKKTVDQAMADALPELRPLLGRRIELIALDSNDEPKRRTGYTIDDFLTHHRLRRPAEVAPLSLDDIEDAIARGARDEDL